MFQIEKSVNTRLLTRKETFGTKMIKTNFRSSSKTETMVVTPHQLATTATGLPQSDTQNSQLASKSQKVANLSSRTLTFISYSSKTQSLYHKKSTENINITSLDKKDVNTVFHQSSSKKQGIAIVSNSYTQKIPTSIVSGINYSTVSSSLHLVTLSTEEKTQVQSTSVSVINVTEQSGTFQSIEWYSDKIESSNITSAMWITTANLTLLTQEQDKISFINMVNEANLTKT